MAKQTSSASTLIRGGQTTQHWWRMGVQVIKFALVVASLIYVAIFLWLVFSTYDTNQMQIAIYYEMAERGVLDANGFDRPYTFKDLSGTTVTRDAVDIYRDATLRSIRDGFFDRIFSASRISIIPAFLAGCTSLVVFLRTGNRIKDNDYIRGARLVTAKQLKQWSKQRWSTYNRKHKGRKKAKPLTVSGIPFPPNAVEAQTCLFGTVGVGKTNAMSEMLQTIRQNGGRAIIYDRMGAFVSRFYDEETDFIINPFDNRSRSWNPFDDVLDVASFTQMAEVMMPDHSGTNDPFWTQSARIVFDYAARELYQKGPRTVDALIDFVIRMDADQLSKLISATPGAHFFNENIEKTAQSIRANMIAELRFLEFLRDDAEALSIRKWMASKEPSFLFLTGDAEHAAATRTIITTILEIAANALQSQGQASEPRCYFFIDELPTLNRLPFLVNSLATMRQFGGAFVLGYQVYSQLEDIYGREAAQSIAGNTNNRIVFNVPDFRTAKLCSETLGHQDLWEANSNISVGAHEARDGVGFTQQRVERSIVSPAEIQNLPQFQAFAKFAYDSPTARIAMTLFEVDETQPSFQPYMGDAFGSFQREEEEEDQEPADNEDSADDLLNEFHEWCRWQFAVTDLDLKGLKGPHPRFAAYFAHFSEARAKDVPPENINPIVIVSDGLMRNGPAIGTQEAPESTDVPNMLGRGLHDLPLDKSKRRRRKKLDAGASAATPLPADASLVLLHHKDQQVEMNGAARPVQASLALDGGWSPHNTFKR